VDCLRICVSGDEFLCRFFLFFHTHSLSLTLFLALTLFLCLFFCLSQALCASFSHSHCLSLLSLLHACVLSRSLLVGLSHIICQAVSVCLSVSLSVCLFVCLLICLSVYLSVYRPIYQSVCLCVYVFVCPSIFLSLFLSIVCGSAPPNLSVHLSVCLSVYRSLYLSICLSAFLSIYYVRKCPPVSLYRTKTRRTFLYARLELQRLPFATPLSNRAIGLSRKRVASFPWNPWEKGLYIHV